MGDALTRVSLVHDEGPAAGFGHRRRMEALAGALQAQGACAVVGPEATPAEILVVDSYVHRADDRSRYDHPLVVAIDDLERDLAVDLVVDPCPGATAPTEHAASAVLAGWPHLIVDRGLRDLRGTDSDAVRVVLVTAGGTAGDLARQWAGALARALPDVEVRQVVTTGADVADNVVAVHSDRGLDAELAAADLVLTAGGVTMLEALVLGLPTVAVEIAANQRRSLAGVAEAGAALVADSAHAVPAVVTLASDRATRGRLRRTASTLADGHGADRIASAVLRLV